MHVSPAVDDVRHRSSARECLRRVKTPASGRAAAGTTRLLFTRNPQHSPSPHDSSRMRVETARRAPTYWCQMIPDAAGAMSSGEFRSDSRPNKSAGRKVGGLLRGRPMDDRSRWIALLALCTWLLMIVLDLTIVNAALPFIQADLGFSQSSLAWVVNAYLIAFAGLLLLAGRLRVLAGPRHVFLD